MNSPKFEAYHKSCGGLAYYTDHLPKVGEAHVKLFDLDGVEVNKGQIMICPHCHKHIIWGITSLTSNKPPVTKEVD